MEDNTAHATEFCTWFAHWPGKLHYYHTDFASRDTNICRYINSTWNWWTYCDLALLCLLFSFWETLCQKYLASSPQHSVPPDTDSCLNYKGSNVSNEPTEISSYRETLSYPEQPFWPQPQPLSFAKWAFHLLFRYQNEAWCRHRGALKNCTACKRGFAILKPNKPAILFQAYLHTVLTYSAYVHNVKVQISQQPSLMPMKLFATQF